MTGNKTPNFSLVDKVVLVTGASRGIGRACALACAGAGADVIVGIRNPSENKALVNEIEALGRRALAVRMDLADLNGVRAGIAEAHRHFGRIDVLINNVGLGPENLAFSARVGMWSPTACGPASEEEVHIAEVFFDAPGPDDENPNGEFVVIANDGPEVDLTGWMIRDESSTHRFEFPDGFAVGTGESVVIRSGCGQGGTDEVFWCANGAVWNNGGDMALLLDAYGNVVDRWRYQGSR